MAPDWNALKDQLTDLARTAFRIEHEDRSIWLSEAMELVLQPLEEQLKDPDAALEYAARQVGQTIISLGGFEALYKMFDRLECEVGEREAIWICRAWTGLQSLDGLRIWDGD